MERMNQDIRRSQGIICTNCGEMIEDTCKFCPRCGREVKKVTYVKVCTNCGMTLEEDDMFCPVCGVGVRKETPMSRGVCPKCGAIVREGCRFCEKCGMEMNGGGEIPTERPMKWFKFVIYVQLFLSAILSIGTGIQYLTGAIYGDAAAQVYYFCKGLKALDIFNGIFCMLAAVLAIIVRQLLAHYKKSGPGMYYAYEVYCMAYNGIYLIGLMAVGLFEVIGKEVGFTVGVSIASGAVMLVLNIIYFTKRMDLFVN